MPLTTLNRSIVPFYLYPRHPPRALYQPEAGQPIRTPSAKPIVPIAKWIRHFHKHRPTVLPLQLPEPNHRNTRGHNRFLSDTSRDLRTTSTAACPPQPDHTMQRPSTPYSDPKVQGPKAQQLASGSALLRKMMNQANTVNKTGLHPSGVAYVLLPFLLCCLQQCSPSSNAQDHG